MFWLKFFLHVQHKFAKIDKWRLWEFIEFPNFTLNIRLLFLFFSICVVIFLEFIAEHFLILSCWDVFECFLYLLIDEDLGIVDWNVMHRWWIVKIRVFNEFEQGETLKLKYFIFKAC